MQTSEYIDLLVKGLIAFFVPLAWALILYPVIRKFRKSWLTLVVTVSVFSFFSFVLKEGMDKISSNFDQYFTYALGIFFGLAMLSFFFNIKHKWLEALSKDDAFVRKYEINKKPRLRQIIRAAILMEEGFITFYNKLSEISKDTNMKNLYHELVKEEIEHKKLFTETLFRWLPSPIDKDSLDSFTEELKTRGVFLNPPLSGAKEEDIIKYAVGQENKTADFYLSFEKAFPEAWKRMQIQTLVMEERSHANKLINAYPHLGL